MDKKDWASRLVIVRGGGDIATGTIYKLFSCHFPLLVLEKANPSCIRRSVSFCEAVCGHEAVVEDLTAVRVSSPDEAFSCWKNGKIPVMVDPEGIMIRKLRPAVVVDAILAKKNLGTGMEDAPVVIGLGPGFTAGKDVHAVVETKRGHDLGRVIYQGAASADTGTPGIIAGYGAERVIHAPASGSVHIIKGIGEKTSMGEIIAYVGDVPVRAAIPGLIRGMIREGYQADEGLKIADIDPRIDEYENCYRISDKARCIAGGVLEAILHERTKE